MLWALYMKPLTGGIDLANGGFNRFAIISRDRLFGGGVLMAATFSQIGGVIGQLQIRSLAGKQTHREI